MRPYWENKLPGEGCLPPRASAASDIGVMSLNGAWQFRLSPTAAGAGNSEEISLASFDDSGWDTIRVPSHWVLEEVTPPGEDVPRSLRGTEHGPLYTNTAFPIPLDPPHVSVENPTGDYRIQFAVPSHWRGAILRLQGADSVAAVWLNGRMVGWSSGSRLPTEMVLEGLWGGQNTLLIRVHRWSAGTYLEDQDMWWLPGLFRDVDLIELRGQALDHFVHADYDHHSGQGTVMVESSSAGTVTIPELGIEMATGEPVTVPVTPWSAENPRLYAGQLVTDDQTVDLAIGFRSVSIVDGVMVANGTPLKMRGVNRHEHDWQHGRTLARATMRQDILMMKRANINAVRTSHYPPHPDFLRLCDELGLWVVEEGDIETHGFIYAGWEGNPPDDPEWFPAMLSRTQRMVERDKNHPSVIIWSLGNESMAGPGFDLIEQWVRQRDPSRLVHYERDPRFRNSDFASTMYPPLDVLEQYGRRIDPRPDGITDAEYQRRLSLPFLVCEYAHAMGNGPGSLADYQRILDDYDRFCGAFIWEWIDHGFLTSNQAGESYVMHGQHVAGYEPGGGRYCLDGLLYADRSPSPALAEVAAVFAPVQIHIDDQVTIVNRYHSLDLSHLEFQWVVEREGKQIRNGVLAVPPLKPGERVSLPAPGSGDEWVTVQGVLTADAAWAPAGHVVTWAQAPMGQEVIVPAQVGDVQVGEGTVTVGPVLLDRVTGSVVSIAGESVSNLEIDVYRAPTENDRGQGPLNDLASVWHAVGLDRLRQRVDAVEVGEQEVIVRGRSGPAAHPHGVEFVYRWRPWGDGARLDIETEFVGPWQKTPYLEREIVPPRLGARIALPGAYSDAMWLGWGPEETYVDSRRAARFGVYRGSIDAMQTPYAVPQENGNHLETRWLELSGYGVPTLRFSGVPSFDMTVRRWTSQDLAQADTPLDLVDSGQVWLNIDAGQQGVGSAACGPALPQQYRVPMERGAWSVIIEG